MTWVGEFPESLQQGEELVALYCYLERGFEWVEP